MVIRLETEISNRLHKSMNKGRTSADRSTRLLSCLQYLVQIKSSTKDLPRPIFEITIRQPTSRSQRYVDATYTVQAEAIDTRVIGRSFSFLAWILT